MSELLLMEIRDFWVELENISRAHEELTDTDVREAIHEVVNFYFVWGMERPDFPWNFGMFSLDGNKLVSEAVRRFLARVGSLEAVKQTPVGVMRLAMLTNREIVTPSGMTYDMFIGHLDEPKEPELPDYLYFAEFLEQ